MHLLVEVVYEIEQYRLIAVSAVNSSSHVSRFYYKIFQQTR